MNDPGSSSQKDAEKTIDPDATQELPVPKPPEVVRVSGGGEMVFAEKSLEELTSQNDHHGEQPGSRTK